MNAFALSSKKRHTIVDALTIMLLMATPWNTNVSSWALVLFSLAIFLIRVDQFKRSLSSNRILLFFVAYYVYVATYFLIASDGQGKSKLLVDLLPFLLFPLIFISFCDLYSARRQRYLLTFSISITIGFTFLFFYAMYRFWNEFYLFENGYIPVTDLIGIHPSYLSLFLSFAFVIALNVAIEKFREQSVFQRVLYFAWLALLAFGVFYIRSRMGVLAFIVLVLFIIYYRIPRRLKLLLATIFIFALISLVVIVDVTEFHKGRFQIEQIGNAIELKRAQWNSTIEVFKTNPVFGVSGAEDQRLLNNQYEQIQFEEGLRFSYNSHNQFLTTLLQGGLIGFVFLFTPFFEIAWRGIRRNQLLFICFFLITAMSFLTESMLERHKGILFFAFFVNLLAVQGVASSAASKSNRL